MPLDKGSEKDVLLNKLKIELEFASGNFSSYNNKLPIKKRIKPSKAEEVDPKLIEHRIETFLEEGQESSDVHITIITTIRSLVLDVILRTEAAMLKRVKTVEKIYFKKVEIFEKKNMIEVFFSAKTKIEVDTARITHTLMFKKLKNKGNVAKLNFLDWKKLVEEAQESLQRLQEHATALVGQITGWQKIYDDGKRLRWQGIALIVTCSALVCTCYKIYSDSQKTPSSAATACKIFCNSAVKNLWP